MVPSNAIVVPAESGNELLEELPGQPTAGSLAIVSSAQMDAQNQKPLASAELGNSHTGITGKANLVSNGREDSSLVSQELFNIEVIEQTRHTNTRKIPMARVFSGNNWNWWSCSLRSLRGLKPALSIFVVAALQEPPPPIRQIRLWLLSKRP